MFAFTCIVILATHIPKSNSCSAKLDVLLNGGGILVEIYLSTIIIVGKIKNNSLKKFRVLWYKILQYILILIFYK
jgi:hypothetical protein